MPKINTLAVSPFDLAGAALSSPLFSLIIAAIIAGGVLLVASRAARALTRIDSAGTAGSARTRYAPEHHALGISAIGFLGVYLAELVVRGYFAAGPELWWWRFAVPLACGIVGIAVAFVLILTRGTTPPEAAVLPAARRTWPSFSSGRLLALAGVTLLMLLATTVAAGIASSPNAEGQHVWLTIPIPNEPEIDPIRLPFYGWAYGVPVFVCLAVLVAVTWAALNRNAARPFVRPETVAAERAERRGTARGTMFIATAAMLLTLAGAWRLIARAGSGSSLTITGQNADASYEAAWRFSELAVAAGWCAPILEVTSFALLLLVAAGGLRRGASTRTSSVGAETPFPAGAPR